MYHRYSTTRNEKSEEENPLGRFRVASILSLSSLFLMMMGYLFVVNRNAVSGYSLRIAEKRMMELSNEAQKLRIREAELRSLYGLEDASGRLDMKPIEGAVSLDVPGPVAYGK